MSFLAQYDRIAPENRLERLTAVNQWMRTEPRAFFAELRERRPVFVTPGFTMVTRYREVLEVLHQPDVFTVGIYTPKMDGAVGPFMLGRDNTPVNWTDKSIMKSIMPMEDMALIRGMVGELADAALDEAAPAGQIEVIGALGRHVPVQICGRYFGFPGPDEAAMRRWSKATQTDFFKNVFGDPAIHAAAVAAGQEMRAYIGELVAERTAALDKDAGAAPPRGATVVDRFLRVMSQQQMPLPAERIVSNIAGILVGSVETTSQAIAQSLDQLLRRPAMAAQALDAARRGDQPAFDAYVWEALRFNPINPLLFRLSNAPVSIAGGTAHETRLPAGSIVFACTASAMMDPAEVERADEFIPGRPAHQYLHFGVGHHECLGRAIGEVMVTETVKRVLLRAGAQLLAGDAGVIDFQGGPFPERFVIALGKPPAPPA